MKLKACSRTLRQWKTWGLCELILSKASAACLPGPRGEFRKIQSSKSNSKYLMKSGKMRKWTRLRKRPSLLIKNAWCRPCKTSCRWRLTRNVRDYFTQVAISRHPALSRTIHRTRTRSKTKISGCVTRQTWWPFQQMKSIGCFTGLDLPHPRWSSVNRMKICGGLGPTDGSLRKLPLLAIFRL